MKIKILHALILTFISLKSFSQIFDNSQPHFKVKWNQINTNKFRLIFPKEYSASAPTLASQIDYYINKLSNSYNRPPRKINIILQGNHIEQNGFVQLAPRKSEFFSTPSGVADNQEWTPNLALHELTHVLQFDNLTGKINSIFTEQLALALFGINLPSWFYEGDAVLKETYFSNGGRGRLASWNMPIRTNIQSKLDYDFNKYVHGSFKDIVPSYYTIGYFLASELHEKDDRIFEKIYSEMNGKLLRPFNFHRSIKKFYGEKTSKLFENTMTNLSQKWPETPNKNIDNRLLLEDKYPTHYYIPQVINGEILALEHNRQRTSRIVKIDTNNNHQKTDIIHTGIQIMPYFHSREHLITWDEIRKDARFGKQTYNVINTYNTITKQKKTITKSSRLYTPIISPDLQIIAAIDVNHNNNTSIKLLDIEHGTLVDSIPTPAQIHLQQPQFSDDGERIIAIAIGPEGTNLAEIFIKARRIDYLLEWTNLQFERPTYYKNHIVFKANQADKDDIFLYKDGKTYQITDSEFGAFNPSIDKNSIWYNDYTTLGYKINHKNNFDSENLKETNLTKAKSLYASQENNEIAPIFNEHTYKIQRYNKLKNSINFHSIALSGNDYEDFNNLKPGIFWLSNDILNTTITKIGYEYDTDIQKSTYSAELTYQNFYPKITIGYKNTGNFNWAKRENSVDSVVRFDWRENQYYANISIPFSIYRGNRTYSYGVNLGTHYINRYDLTLNVNNFPTEIILPLNYQLYFNRNTLLSAMDLAPKWGQNFSITARHTPFEANKDNYALSFRSSFYFPGILSNHSLQARLSAQTTQGRFNNIYDIPVPTGFDKLGYTKLKNTLLLDYKFPIAYPDHSIGQLAYIKRIHANISANYINLQETNISPKTTSIGINFDFNLFKYNLPLFSLSVKTSYLDNDKLNNKFLTTYGINYSY